MSPKPVMTHSEHARLLHVAGQFFDHPERAIDTDKIPVGGFW